MSRKGQRNHQTFWQRHSLSLIAAAILALWLGLYAVSDPESHSGSFFGNAVADWTGLLAMVVATKWFQERGSAQSHQPARAAPGRLRSFLRQHSLTLVLLITGLSWVALFCRLNPQARWGTVVSNLVSEWSQLLGLVLLTKKLGETGSKES